MLLAVMLMDKDHYHYLERMSVAFTKRVLSPGSAGIPARQACASTLPQVA
jgi:hypothetical protein